LLTKRIIVLNKILKSALLSLFGVFFLITTILAFNADIRRHLFTRIIPAYNLYQIISISQYLRIKNFSTIADRLISYIDLAKSVSSGKSQMLLGVYDAVSLAASKATTQSDFNELEKVFYELVEMDPDMYKARVWLARSISDTSYKIAFQHINKAIEISPVQDSAYREAIRISQNINDSQLASQYCNKYIKSQFGGELPRNYRNFFGGTSIRNFSIELPLANKESIFYPNAGIQLDKNLGYEFIPIKPVDIDRINLFFSFPAGTVAKIKEVSFYSKSGIKTIPAVDFTVSSSSAYILNENKDGLTMLLGGKEDEVVRFRHRSTVHSVAKIVITIDFSRLPLGNYKMCNIIN
jgi:hypothetical protein